MLFRRRAYAAIGGHPSPAPRQPHDHRLGHRHPRLHPGDEELILGAVAGLFCVADPAKVTWIKQRRPDALDLYVL
jgi:hypothetical protein